MIWICVDRRFRSGDTRGGAPETPDGRPARTQPTVRPVNANSLANPRHCRANAEKRRPLALSLSFSHPAIHAERCTRNPHVLVFPRLPKENPDRPRL